MKHHLPFSPAVFRAFLFPLVTVIIALGISTQATRAATQDGALRMEVITAYNFVVDSNIESPAGKSPSAAHLAVKIFNDGPTALTNVVVNIGKLTTPSTSSGTPGVFESRTVNEVGQYEGTFALQMPGGAADANRVIPRIEPGQHVVQYFFVTYPLKDPLGRSVTGSAPVVTDDLWLNYDMWASASDGLTTRRVDKTTKVTMRNEISAMANKILPNGDNKVPIEYLDVIESALGWRPSTVVPRIPGASISEGIWYDLGNVGAGFDNNGDGIPDRNAWLQPVGDPSKFSPLAARLVKCYGLVIVKLNDGTEQLIPFEDRLYFENILANNTGAVGLVFYEFLTLNSSLPSSLTPYQEVASGYDNEKFNSDYGTVVLTAATPPSLSLTKTGPAGAAPNSVVQYAISATNTGSSLLGNPSLSLPPTFEDAIPANLTYVAGSATANNTLPVGTTATVTWFSNVENAWVATEPPAATVTHVRWALSAALAPSATATVRFQAQVASNYSAPTIVNTGIFKLGTTGSLATATATTNVGSFSIGDLVWQDTNSNQAQDGGETGIANVTVRLYRDLNNNGIVDPSDTLVATTVTASNGAYSFSFLQNQRYIAAVDTTSSGLVTRFGAGLYQNTTPVTKLYATLPSSATDADFGFVAFVPASIGDQVYFDRNGNGSYEPASDLPLPNVTVNLYNNVGTLIATTSTNLSGEYLFANRAPGTYTVSVDILDTDIPAYLSAPVSSFANFAIIAGQNDLTRDFRFTDPGNITKQVNLSQLITPGQLTFTLRPSYSGNLLTNAFVQDTLPTGTTFASAGQGGSNLPPVTWNLGSNTAATSGASTIATNFITHVASSTATNAGGGSASGSLTLPAGTQQGDVMLLSFALATNATITPPAGWTSVQNLVSGALFHAQTFWKLAGAGETGPAFTLSASSRWSATLSSYRNVDQTAPIDVSSQGVVGTTANIVAPSVTTTVANTRLVGVFAVDHTNGGSVPAGMTQTATVSSGAGPNGSSILVADQAQPAAGATGTRTSTVAAGDENVGFLIALRPAAANSFTTTSAISNNTRRLVTGGTRVTVTLTATATGNAGTVTAPTNLTLVNAVNSVTATKFSGPTPASATLNNGSVSFNYEYDMAQGTLPGSVAFQGVPTSTVGTFGTATSPSLLVTPPLTLTVNVPSGSNQSSVTNSAFFYHNTNILLGQSQPTVTTLDGSIGDYVWADVNGDGLQTGESGIPGVRVYVDSNGNGLFDVGEPSAVSNHLGAYAISGLGAGTYSVRYDLTTVPTGYVATTGTSISVPLTAGQQAVTADFGLRPPGSGSIGDFVWRDANGNGLPDTGEVGLSGVTVTLYRDSGTAGVLDGSDVVLAAATTDANGAYLFPNLHAGNYLVVVNPGSSAIPNDSFGSKLVASTSMSRSLALGVGQTVLTADFGFTAGGVIGDFVFYDSNGNGSQDYTETGVPGVTVQLFRQSDTNTVIATAVTSSSGVNPAGFYQFTGLAPGTYYTRVLTSSLAAGLIQTADPDFDGVPAHPVTNPGDHADSTIVLNFGSSYSGADFGYQPPGSIGDYVWLDVDRDGVQDVGEPGIAGVVIRVTNGVTTYDITTDTDGLWAQSVADGNWTVSVLTPPADRVNTYDADSGITSPNASVAVTVAGGVVTSPAIVPLGQRNMALDFGYALNGDYGLIGTVAINDNGDTLPTLGKHNDIDDFFDDGTDFDAGPNDETELENVLVYLYSSTGTFLGSTFTDAGGNYVFTNLPNGSYRVIIGTTAPPLDRATLNTTNGNYTNGTTVTNTGTSVIQNVTIAEASLFDIDFMFDSTVNYDFGDLAASYGITGLAQDGARHIITGGPATLYMGTNAPDMEINGTPSLTASSDDTTGMDDDDGVTFNNTSSWVTGANVGAATVQVTGSGYLVAWVDWNNDRDFLDDGEMIANQTVSTGNLALTINIPASYTDYSGPTPVVVPIDITGNKSWLSRFRLFPSAPAFPAVSYVGEALGGEVEDHLVQKTSGASIGDIVWIDSNGDGLLNGLEVGLGGVLVELRSSSNVFITSQTTSNGAQDVDGDGLIDPVGYYRFTNLSAATYNIVIPTPPLGYTPSFDANGIATPNTTQVVLGSSVQNLSADFGYQPLVALISGQVRFDVDSDGNLGDPDSGAPSVTVQLWTDPNGDGNPTDGVQVGETTTNASGSFTFSNVPTGNYVVVEINPAGSTSTADVDGGNFDRITVAMAGVNVTGRDFLDTAPPGYLVAIGDFVFNDLNANGQQDSGESGLDGVSVSVFRPGFGADGIAGNEDDAASVATTTTAGGGAYSFAGLPPGTYQLGFGTFAGYTRTLADQGADATDSDANAGTGLTTTFAIAAGATNNTVDAGYYLPDLDTDDDGIPDTLEVSSSCNGGDTDGDGVPDILDLDSDGDGILDVVEAGNGALDANLDGRIDSTQGANGLADIVETAPDSSVINYTLPDRDGDGRPDHLDLDSDNDSISDVLESGNGAVVDAQNDGIADGAVNSNGTVAGAGLVTPTDNDLDLQPDYLDVDSDNDGVFDIVDNGYSSLDSNGNGIIDNSASPADCDGIADVLDPQDDVYGWFPEMGCVAWNLRNPFDTDEDVFPKVQEYVFGVDPLLGHHRVVGVDRRAGMAIEKNPTGGVDISYIRPAGRFDAVVTPYVSPDPRVPGNANWTAVTTPPAITDNGDGTQTVKWANIHDIDGNAAVTRDRGFVRLRVATSCEPGGSWTLVQGWCREFIAGKRQTYGVNFTSMPVFTGYVNSASGTTVTSTASGKGQNLGTYLAGGAPCYIEFTDGPQKGHRFDIASGGTNTFSLNLASLNNTRTTLPADLAGSHYVVRRHETLGGIYPNLEWDASTTPGSADQVLLYSGSGYDTYFNLSLGNTWAKQGAGFGSQNGLVIAPGTGMLVVHANPNDTNEMLAFGDLRYNDFRRPVKLGTSGLNLTSLGFPFDESPGSLNMTVANGFLSAVSPGSSTQILNWVGDTVVNTTGWTTNFQLFAGDWRTQGNIGVNTTNSPLFRHCRAAHVDVQVDQLNWTHTLPWNPAPWVQPAQ